MLNDIATYEDTDQSFLFDSLALHKLQTYDGGDFIRANQDAADELGVTILLNTPAEELIVENGIVKGITGTGD